MLAMIEMPAAKLLRLPEDWDKYRAPDAAAPAVPRKRNPERAAQAEQQ